MAENESTFGERKNSENWIFLPNEFPFFSEAINDETLRLHQCINWVFSIYVVVLSIQYSAMLLKSLPAKCIPHFPIQRASFPFPSKKFRSWDFIRFLRHDPRYLVSLFQTAARNWIFFVEIVLCKNVGDCVVEKVMSLFAFLVCFRDRLAVVRGHVFANFRMGAFFELLIYGICFRAPENYEICAPTLLEWRLNISFWFFSNFKLILWKNCRCLNIFHGK